MNKAKKGKREARRRRRSRVRQKVLGTGAKPRLSVYRSLNHIYAQIIDDETGTTLASVSSLKITLAPAGGEAPHPETEVKKDKKDKKGGKQARPDGIKFRRSRAVGQSIAELALGKNIKQVVFDRSGFIYHGRVAALAEAARKAGLEF